MLCSSVVLTKMPLARTLTELCSFSVLKGWGGNRLKTGDMRALGFRSDHKVCHGGVWVCFTCLPIPLSRIADFHDVLKEPTIALEKLRELSFSGKW